MDREVMYPRVKTCDCSDAHHRCDPPKSVKPGFRRPRGELMQTVVFVMDAGQILAR
jgi:hypothetical protein